MFPNDFNVQQNIGYTAILQSKAGVHGKPTSAKGKLAKAVYKQQMAGHRILLVWSEGIFFLLRSGRKKYKKA